MIFVKRCSSLPLCTVLHVCILLFAATAVSANYGMSIANNSINYLQNIAFIRWKFPINVHLVMHDALISLCDGAFCHLATMDIDCG